MILLPPRSTRTDTLFPYTTLFRSLLPAKSCRFVCLHRRGWLYNAQLLPIDEPWRVGKFDVHIKLQVLEEFVERAWANRSEEHTSELQSLMRISYAVFCLKKKKTKKQQYTNM